MNPIEVVIRGMTIEPTGHYCQWLVDMVRLEGKPPPKNTYAGIVLSLMLAGI